MLEVIALVVGIAIGVAIQRLLSRRASAISPPEPAAAPPAASLPGAPPPPSDPNAEATGLTARLAPLREALESAVESSAHPREIADRVELKQAAALLADPQVPADFVMDYAFGGHAALACAALAALAQRKDPGTAAAAVLARVPQLDFGTKLPWHRRHSRRISASAKSKATRRHSVTRSTARAP